MSALGPKFYKPQVLKMLQETSININRFHRNGEQDSGGTSGWNSSQNGEEMEKQIAKQKYGVVEEIPKSKWRRRLLQSQRRNKNRSSDVEHRTILVIYYTRKYSLTILRIQMVNV